MARWEADTSPRRAGGQSAPVSSLSFPPKAGERLEPRLARGIGKVSKKTVDPQSVKHLVLQHRVALEVRREPPRLVAEGPGVDKKSDGVGLLDEAARGQEHAIALVDLAIAVEIVGLAVA